MKQILLMIAVVALVGCGKKTAPSEPVTNAEPKVAAEKPEPPKTEPKPEAKIPTNAFVNTLGMPFVPVPGTDVQFCIWETRVKDYAAYAAANAGVDASWKSPGFKQEDTHPVVKVNWEDANAFCAWLTKKELAAGKIKGGAEVPIADGCGMERGGGLGPGDGKLAGRKGCGREGCVPVGQGVASAEGGGELFQKPEAGRL